MSSVQLTLDELLASLPQRGALRWIGVRPTRRAPLLSVQCVSARAGAGLEGDHFSGGERSKRQVTLLQSEHLSVIAQLLHRPTLDPALLRRNLLVSGINLTALNGAQFRIGEAVFLGTGACHPCSRLEETLGPGGYNVVRGHGGITAQVLVAGTIRVGDEVHLISAGRLSNSEQSNR